MGNIAGHLTGDLAGTRRLGVRVIRPSSLVAQLLIFLLGDGDGWDGSGVGRGGLVRFARHLHIGRGRTFAGAAADHGQQQKDATKDQLTRPLQERIGSISVPRNNVSHYNAVRRNYRYRTRYSPQLPRTNRGHGAMTTAVGKMRMVRAIAYQATGQALHPLRSAQRGGFTPHGTAIRRSGCVPSAPLRKTRRCCARRANSRRS